eukprot:1043984-Rhodomonas_salina.3
MYAPFRLLGRLNCYCTSLGWGDGAIMCLCKEDRGPGPGEYGLGSVVGPDKPPPYKSAPSFGFGTSARLPGDGAVPKRLDRSTMEKLNQSGASGFG